MRKQSWLIGVCSELRFCTDNVKKLKKMSNTASWSDFRPGLRNWTCKPNTKKTSLNINQKPGHQKHNWSDRFCFEMASLKNRELLVTMQVFKWCRWWKISNWYPKTCSTSEHMKNKRTCRPKKHKEHMRKQNWLIEVCSELRFCTDHV